MGKYTEDSRELLELVGGKDNIAVVSHCTTRMRFVLGDPKKADVKRIEAMKAVKGSFTQAGQFQVIIGNTVAEFYKDFMDVAGIEGVSKDAVKQAAQRNQNILQRAAAIAAEIFAPLIPAIITGGLILGFRNCIDQLYLFENSRFGDFQRRVQRHHRLLPRGIRRHLRLHLCAARYHRSASHDQRH